MFNILQTKGNVANIFVTVHKSVVDTSKRMLLEVKRHNYVTPTNYLELVSGYKTWVLSSLITVTWLLQSLNILPKKHCEQHRASGLLTKRSLDWLILGELGFFFRITRIKNLFATVHGFFFFHCSYFQFLSFSTLFPFVFFVFPFCWHYTLSLLRLVCFTRREKNWEMQQANWETAWTKSTTPELRYDHLTVHDIGLICLWENIVKYFDMGKNKTCSLGLRQQIVCNYKTE